jgi:O-antigen ligase
MGTTAKELRTVSLVSWGSLVVTLLVTDKVGTDPVNVGKQLALASFAFALLPLIVSNLRLTFKKANLLTIGIALFLGSSLVSVFTSKSPLERGLYGAFGRNTGLLTYFAFVVFFLAAKGFSKNKSYEKLIHFFVASGAINILLSIASANGMEIFSWDNPNNFVLGTFGNSNFIGAFMGILFTILFIQLLGKLRETKNLILLVIGLCLTGYVILLSNALQGILVAGIGASLALYFFLRSTIKFHFLSRLYLGTLFIGGFIGLMGILQKGPLSSFLYKPSVTFRGEYWKTGLNMWLDNPITGVGIDSYGQFYRTFRSLESTVSPGMNVVTDASHNVYIDIIAGTGFVGVVGYLMVVFVVIVSAFKFIRTFKEFDATFYSLFLGWLGYQVQSIVSINQIGLAIWGWALGGAVIGYSLMRCGDSLQNQDELKQGQVKSKASKEKSKDKTSEGLLDPTTLIKVLASFLIGFLIALPPFLSDAKMRSFLAGKGTPEGLMELTKQWPRDASRINRAVVTLAQRDQILLAEELAAFGTTIFPNDYASWYALYQISQDGTPMRQAYKEKLHEIDPFNPEYFKK